MLIYIKEQCVQLKNVNGVNGEALCSEPKFITNENRR